MENQGFEVEYQPRSEGTPMSCSQAFSSDSLKREISNADSHVYEDILAVAEDTSKHSLAGEETIDGDFRRSLTLPFRRGTTGHDPSSGSSSVRATNRKRSENATSNSVSVPVPVPVSVPGFEDIPAFRAQSTAPRAECRPNRRRRKKDCKHCRIKAAACIDGGQREIDRRENDTILRKNRDNELWKRQRLQKADSSNAETILDSRKLTVLSACLPNEKPDVFATRADNDSQQFSVLTIFEKTDGYGKPFGEKEINDDVDDVDDNKDGALGRVGSEKSHPGMRVNSIYSQDRWYAKEAPVFFTDLKERGSSFQRASLLPERTQTPSSQNRINLRRSVRGEPSPHPARLRKHRHGWTLHLAHPLETSGCTRSLVLLLIALLLLLGIGAIALYFAFEPEKLEIVQQYLRSSTNGEQRNGTSTASPSPSSTLVANILLNSDSSLPESRTPLQSEAETETTSLDSTRYCDDCLPEEVCVALVDEEIPTCKIALDSKDPTGCAGFCLINKQKCHRLDVDAFRCVEIEHYCLDDEWTCLNTLCIPLERHCDGYMNCYDHSDEYNCVCDLKTHFQCGNETSCLPLEKRCDGKVDCWDAADEINCTLGCPSENEFTCNNGQCVLKIRFCDGFPDCLDGSDEPHGCQVRCNKYEFTCQNGRCITKVMKCNGIDDCGDGTDERHCKDRFS